MRETLQPKAFEEKESESTGSTAILSGPTVTGVDPVRSAVLTRLRELPGIVREMGQLEPRAFSLVPGGVPRGALVEIGSLPGSAWGGGRTECVLRFLAENPTLRVAWVETWGSVYPCAFSQYGVSLDRVLFIQTEVENETEVGTRAASTSCSSVLWTTHQLLRSRLFGAIVIDDVGVLGGTALSQAGETELRRLQLAAEKAQTCVFLLSKQLRVRDRWPITLQWEVGRFFKGACELRVEVRKQRGWAMAHGGCG